MVELTGEVISLLSLTHGLALLEDGRKVAFYLGGGRGFESIAGPGNHARLGDTTLATLPPIGTKLICNLEATGPVVLWGLLLDYEQVLEAHGPVIGVQDDCC